MPSQWFLVVRDGTCPKCGLAASSNGTAKRRIAGLKVTATDMGWSHESGPPTGPAEALVIMMAGRSVALDDLSVEAKAALVTRRSLLGNAHRRLRAREKSSPPGFEGAPVVRKAAPPADGGPHRTG
jgi:hypothetical protein